MIKKKFLLMLLVIFAISCLFAISISATPQNYKSYEVELVSGERITVYEAYDWDPYEGRIYIRDTMYTEAPSDTDGTYATLDWSKVRVLDFSNTWLHQYNSTTNEWNSITGRNSSFHLMNNSFTPANCTNLEKVITGKLTYIRGAALKNLPALKELVIDNSLTNIQYNAFDGCKALTTITLKEGVRLKDIAQQTFKSCTALVKITLPDTVTSMGDSVFDGCTSLETVNWSSQMTKIPNGTFSGCTKLIFEIPEHVTSIGGNAFRNCDSLVKFVIPDTVTTIGGFILAECDNLEEVVITENSQITSTLTGVIYKCPKIKSFRMPPLVTEMGYDNFWDCTSLTDVIWPDNLTTISGGNNFSGCTALTSIKIPNTVTSMPKVNFSGCTNLTDIWLGANLPAISNGQLILKNIKRIYFSSSVTTIGQYIVGYSNPADSSGNITFIFTGTKEEATTLQAYLKTNGEAGHAPNNSKFYDAVLVSASEYDVTQEPNGFHLVYDYSACEAFYNGVHKLGDITYELPENYISSAYDKCFCSECSYVEIVKEYSPIISLVGFSAKENSKKVCMTYKLNKEALEKFETETGKVISIGVTAAADFDASLTEYQPLNNDLTPIGKAISVSVNKSYGSFDFVLSGFTAEHFAKALVMCAYVSDGTAISYVDSECKSKASVFTFGEKIA